MKICFQLLAGLAALIILVPGCSHKSTQTCGPCAAHTDSVPHMFFQVVSKTTGNNLFYSASAQYSPSQLAMHHIVNGKADTVTFDAVTAQQGFEVFVTPVHAQDTVTMNIANLPQDTFVFHTGTTETCCPNIVLNYVTYNGTMVYSQEDANKVIVLQK
jgi:hypothetical protein